MLVLKKKGSIRGGVRPRRHSVNDEPNSLFLLENFNNALNQLRENRDRYFPSFFNPSFNRNRGFEILNAINITRNNHNIIVTYNNNSFTIRPTLSRNSIYIYEIIFRNDIIQHIDLTDSNINTSIRCTTFGDHPLSVFMYILDIIINYIHYNIQSGGLKKKIVLTLEKAKNNLINAQKESARAYKNVEKAREIYNKLLNKSVSGAKKNNITKKSVTKNRVTSNKKTANH